ncbi:MAG: exodeoxyribonuclease VII large subunit [Chlamydiia bacterium]|nr:exodeoxyribonuclease VII large subunit [Chlamydiia bacterium]
MQTKIFTVSELTEAIKRQLEGTFRVVYLEGEVSNCKRQASGHIYFSLKDQGAQIGAVMFRGDALNLSQIPKDGDHVRVAGSLNVYPPSGRYQIVVRQMQFAGLGELLLKLEALKQKLSARGWFAPEVKKAIPRFPKRIGIVTSPTGAVIRDILNVLKRRYFGFEAILYPVKVQGEGAKEEIAQAIADFNRWQLADVLIVGRGGGSMEDLWPFNEEIVATAIHESTIPIISAVGHETDHTLADYVADLRAPTPSAAAELVSAEKLAQLEHLKHIEKRLIHSVRAHLSHTRTKLQAFTTHPTFASPYALLGPHIQKLDDFRNRLDWMIDSNLKQRKLTLQGMAKQLSAMNPLVTIAHSKQRLSTFNKSLSSLIVNILNKQKQCITHYQSLFEALNPENVLKKGYTILFAEKEKCAITSVQQLKRDQNVQIRFADGQATATINAIEEK